ncbi:MAG: hypothetical protein M0D57_02265 [Sphingobacteriales bacterium JAD_PAG50586_3]|nr:MAG: hypothetical protein M0D57_02265 [Sphingobacteriales bacterium JAD_PAG50586_3]
MPVRGTLDIGYWVGWALNMNTRGFKNAYTIPELNYNPLFLYVLYGYGYVMHTLQNIEENINYLKIFVLLFDFAPVMLLMWWLNKNGRSFFNGFFILFNIAYLYNTIYWGQVDAIHTALIFFAIYLAIEQKLSLSLLLFLLAINTKTQSVFFLPILGLLWLPSLKGNGRQLLKSLGLLVIAQLLIILPFLIGGTTSHVLNNYVGVVDFNHGLSMHADNFWYLMMWDSADLPFLTSDQNQWLGFTLKTWGLILFFAFATVVLLPLLIKAIVNFLQRTRFSLAGCEHILLTGALVTLVFFYFPTQMHERYSHPAMLFMGGYFMLSRRWFMFLLLSFAYVMNLEAVDRSWKMANYNILIFDA